MWDSMGYENVGFESEKVGNEIRDREGWDLKLRKWKMKVRKRNLKLRNRE